MEFSKELREKYKNEFKKDGSNYTDEEADEALNNLAGLYKIMWELSVKQVQLKRRLKKEPNGFPVDGHYSCLICGNSINETNGWYDWFGQTCLTCYKAIKTDTIPAFVCTDRDSHFKMWQLKSDFGWKYQTVKKMIKEGKLKARLILNENGTVHEHIFLKKENLGLISRYSPQRKSYDRHRARISKISSRDLKQKMLEEKKKWDKKYIKEVNPIFPHQV